MSEAKTPAEELKEAKIKAISKAQMDINKILEDNDLKIVIEQLIKVVPK